MKITRKQLKQIIREELQRLDEIPTHLKMAAARRGVPHMGSAPGPRRSGDPDDDSDDAAELRDIADDLEALSSGTKIASAEEGAYVLDGVYVTDSEVPGLEQIETLRGLSVTHVVDTDGDGKVHTLDTWAGFIRRPRR